MKYKIGIITQSRQLEERFSYLAKKEDCELLFRIGEIEPAVSIAYALEQEDHVDALLCPPPTYQSIRGKLSIPCAPIYLDSFTLLKGIDQARKSGGRIAFVQFYNPESIYDFDTICSILDCQVDRFMPKCEKEIEPMIREIAESGYNVLISTAEIFRDMARKYDLPAMQIKLRERELLNPLRTVKMMAETAHQSVVYTRFREALLNASTSGIIGIDEHRNAAFINSTARYLLDIPERFLSGNVSIHELTRKNPLLKRVFACQGGLEIIPLEHEEASGGLLVEKQDIFDNQGSLMGAVFQINTLEKVQNFELKARKLAHKSGQVARHTFQDIKGESPALLDCVKTAKRYAATSSRILIVGESGTGKEIFAQSIHNYSHYRSGPFLAINCATLPENLLESELFGYEDGAFTGAAKGGKAGLFESAHGGTLFLDEIGEMPIQLQSKLLRVLEEKSVRRIGGNKSIDINVRIISATNRSLEDEVANENFRQDLYYRINVLTLQLPPLRERKEDIPHLVSTFAGSFSIQEGKNLTIPSAHLRLLMDHDWPGNVRELHNFVEKYVALSQGGPLSAQAVAQMLPSSGRKPPHTAPEGYLTVPIGTIREIDQDVIRQLYAIYGGDREKLLKLLGISNATLWRRLKELNLQQDRQAVHASRRPGQNA